MRVGRKRETLPKISLPIVFASEKSTNLDRIVCSRGTIIRDVVVTTTKQHEGCHAISICKLILNPAAARIESQFVARTSCMASTTKLATQLHRIAAQWTVDPFRPHLQLKTFLLALADHPQLTPQAVRAARALQDNEFQKKVRVLHALLEILY